MRATSIAYLAGIVDGEGYVGIKKSSSMRAHQRRTPSYQARLQVRMVDQGAISFLTKTLGGSYHKEQPNANNGRPLFCWEVSNKLAETIIRSLFPFLRVKKRQAVIVLALRTLQASGRRYRTKISGTRQFLRRYGAPATVRTFCFSDKYVARCDRLWMDCRKLNGLARFQ